MSEPRVVTADIARIPSGLFQTRVLDSQGLLRRYLIGTRRRASDVNPARQRLFPIFGLINYIAARTLPQFPAESVRFAAVPIFERWVQGKLEPGDHLLTGFGYLNNCLEWVKQRGGLALLDARNSHPSNFWSLMAEEYAIWGCKFPPVYPVHHLRQQRSVVLADYIFSPSRFVTESFASRGFPQDRILYLPYPVDRTVFRPSPESRPRSRPLTIVNTGQLTLRKGSPYIFEAFEKVRSQIPNARLLLSRNLASNFEPVFQKKGWDRLPIEWAGRLPYEQFVKRLHAADIFVLPSLEDGFGLVVTEALGCGLPVITTPNTGAVDCIQPGLNGSIVPIRDPERLAQAILEWWERIQRGENPCQEKPTCLENLSWERFHATLVAHLEKIGLLPK